MVLAEAMRLYPPVWIIARRSLIADTLPSGVTIPPQANVAMSQYVAHRNPRYFPNPERFIPERFCDHKGQEHPTYSYFPFGRGVRSCIGEQFSKIEAILMIATIIQKCRFTLVPGQVIVPEPLITIRPKRGLLMKVKKQQS